MKKGKHRALSLLAAAAMIFSCTPALSYYEPETEELGGLSSREVGIRVAEEGMVLLKNDNQALPLKKGDTVAVFGINQVDYIYGGGGSGDMTSEYYTNLVDGLKDNGSVTVYEGLRSMYQKKYDDYWKNVGTTYGYGSKQGAVIMFSDETTLTDQQVKDARAAADTAIITIGRPAGEDKDRSDTAGDFRLSNNEKKMVEQVKNANFDKVIVILNVAGVTDTTWFDGIDAALVVYFPGMDGGRAMADVLCGDAYPSGKLVDTWTKNCSDYASSPYFGTSTYTKYEEDIFVGYRYFETVPGAYDKVNYEFGYGLSYTDFEVSGIEVTHDDENITVSADVTNVGDTYKGKEVLQVYYGAPEVKLTQPKKELAAFAKTKELAPGETDHLTVSFPINDMASYDDVGKTGHEAAYVLEAGDYKIYVGTSVRQCEQVYTYNVPELVVTEQLAHRLVPDTGILKQRMKSDGTFEPLTATVAAPRTPDKYEELYTNNPTSDDKFITFNEVSKNHDLLPAFVSRLTDDEMVRLVGCVEEDKAHGHRTGVGDIPYLGVPLVGSTNGPAGIQYNGASQTDPEKNATFFPCATMQASTWNTELIELLGKAIGLEGAHFGFDLLQAPGMNIHRHPRGGRNFEYFSEDPYITGEMGIALTNGLQSEYVGAQPKHFALNNQETDRWNNNSVCSERAIREIYLKGYEKVVKEAHPWSMMSAYDKINGVNSTANYELLTEILRNEWGFDGFVMTDFYATTTHLGEIVGSTDLRAPYSTVKPNELLTGLANGTLQRWELQRASHNILNYVLRTRDGVALQTTPFNYQIDFGFTSRAALTDGSVLLSENLSVKAFMESIVDKYNQKYELLYKDADGNESTVAKYNVNLDGKIECDEDIQVGAGMTLCVRSEDDSVEESYPIAIGSLSLKQPVRASATENGNPPENTVDSVLTTRWSAYVNASKTSENYGNWIEVDLGDIYYLSSLSLYCYRNKECAFTYDVWAKASNEVWDDDVTKNKDFAKNGYKQILSAGKTVKGDKASVQKLSGQARYIVIKVNSSDNTKAKAPSIYELEVNGWKLTSDVYDIDHESKTITIPAYTSIAEAEKNLNLAGKASLDIERRGPYVGDSITVVDDLGQNAAVYSVNATPVGEAYGKIDFADGLKPEATSSDAGHAPELAVDGDEETFWQAANSGGGESISLSLGVPRYVERVRVNMGENPAPYTVYYDRDGEWVNAGDHNGGEPEIDLGGVSTEKIKIDFAGVGSGDRARLYSLNVYGTMFADYARETKYLTDMEDEDLYAGWGDIVLDRSIDHNPITLSGKVYEKGLGLHADSGAVYNLDGNYYRFTAVIGMDDEIGTNGDGAVFEVYGTDGDGAEKLMYSQTVATINDPHVVDIDVLGIKKLRLVTTMRTNADGDHTDWAIPMLWGSTRDISTGGDWRVVASAGADKYVRIDRNNNDGASDYFYSKLVYLDLDGNVISERSEGFVSAGNTTIQALKDSAPEGTAFTRLEVRNSAGELIGSGFVGTGEPVSADDNFIYISDIPSEYITQGWEGMTPGINAAIGGRSIKVNGVHYKKGLGLHADSSAVYDLDGKYSRFTAVIGIDDEVNSENPDSSRDGATFRVYSTDAEGEDKLLYERHIDSTGTSQTVDVNVSGVKLLRLETDMGANNAQDHTDWADAKLYFKPELILDGNTVKAINAPEGSELIVAVYKDGMLVDVARAAAGQTDGIPVGELLDKGDRVSAYLWNIKAVTPYTETLDIK